MRMASVGLRVGCAIGAGSGNVLRLNRCWSDVAFAGGEALLRRGLMLDSAGSAVVGNVGVVHDGVVMDDGLVHVGVVDDGRVHVNDCGVIGELAAAPLAAGKADAHVAEAIVDTAVEADVRSPVAFVEEELAAFPTPPGRGPQKADGGRGNPGAGNPVIPVGTVGPVAGSPHQVGF